MPFAHSVLNFLELQVRMNINTIYLRQEMDAFNISPIN